MEVADLSQTGTLLEAVNLSPSVREGPSLRPMEAPRPLNTRWYLVLFKHEKELVSPEHRRDGGLVMWKGSNSEVQLL